MMKTINMFRVGISPAQYLSQEDIIKIITTERNQTEKQVKKKRGCGGVIPTMKMLMIFMSRKT